MAKWGEGDPRWLVEDRPDATNVNNWHWTEKNASQWSQDMLKELLVGLNVTNDQISGKITEMTKCEGEATVNNRKAKLIFFYEWGITLKWEGNIKDGEEATTGTMEVLNLSEEHELKDVDISVMIDKSGTDSDKVKEFFRIKGVELVKDRLGQYLKSLREEYSKGLILPTKNSKHSVSEIKQPNAPVKNNKDTSVKKSASKNELFEVDEFSTTEIFKCRADEFYRVLTTKELMQVFTQGDCVVEPEVGGKFELYGGNVHGQFVELIPNRLIKMKWRFKLWPAGHLSDVKIDIQELPDSTEVKIHQARIPKIEMENTMAGWKRYYWDSIKRAFGFGAALF